MKKSLRPAHYDKILETTRIAGDQAYLLILMELVLFGETSFNELKRMTNINQVTLSRKLVQLRELGLVDVHKSGIEHHYTATEKSQNYKKLLLEITRIAKIYNT